jgi:hypothetical protein
MNAVRSLRPASSLLFPALLALLVAGCGEDGPTFSAPDRTPSDRTPLTAACDDNDALRCLLPWPSSTFTEKDASTATGLRLAVEAESLPAVDDPRSFALADGFSRVSPLMTGFTAVLDPSSFGTPGQTPVKLLLAQHDHPKRGESVPLRLTALDGEDAALPESLLFAYPLRPLEPNADYVAVVTDDLKTASGSAPARSRGTEIALGLATPASQAEADLAAYHAPTRARLAETGIDPEHVVRVWDFTTRSGDDATHRLADMRAAAIAAVDAGEVEVVIDLVETSADPTVAAIVEGHLVGLPSFLEADSDLSLDAAGEVVAAGEREAPFYVLIPQGPGDYRFVMFGHGMGGNYNDDSFDSELSQNGVGKVGIQFYGWTDKDVIDTFVSMARMVEATHRSSARLMQAIADGSAIQRAAASVLGDALSAPILGGKPNPAVGRRPDSSVPMWAGGSLGGTMGIVYASADPDMHYGVLNVPGAAWTHFVPQSMVYDTVRGLLRPSYGGDLDVGFALAMSQSNWDAIDGAVWADRMPDEESVYLVQESIGDPVLPNVGSEMLAVATGATQVGAVLVPILGVPTAEEAAGKTGLTQFKIAGTDPYEVHGFAAGGSPAGVAARQQITAYLKSAWEGQPKISVPASCPGGNCDFSGSK